MKTFFYKETRINFFLKAAILDKLIIISLLFINSCSENHYDTIGDIIPTSIRTVEPDELSYSFSELSEKNFPLGQTKTLTYSFSDLQLREFTEREKKEQVRDWLILSILSEIGLSEEEYNKVILDYPVSRLEHLSLYSNMEYGLTRSRYIDDGLIIALIPSSRRNQKKDHIAYMADEWRKTIGSKPDSIWIFEYSPIKTGCPVKYWRDKTVFAESIFSPTYGYFEKVISGVSDLEGFLGLTNDLTFASKINENQVLIGGRKILSQDNKRITIQEVAALWQAESKLKLANQALNDFNEYWTKKSINSIEGEHSEIQKQRVALSALELKYKEDGMYCEGTGFSLDPKTNFDSLLFYFQEIRSWFGAFEKWCFQVQNGKQFGLKGKEHILWSMLSSEEPYLIWLAKAIIKKASAEESMYAQPTWSIPDRVGPFALTQRLAIPSFWEVNNLEFLIDEHDTEIIGEGELDKVQLALNNKEIKPYLKLIDRLSKSRSFRGNLLYEVLKDLKFQSSYQEARYDGDLQGTSVGMHEFYCDLLAKIWMNDLYNSCPREVIPDFASELTTNSPIHTLTESILHPSIRIWFGIDNNEYQFTSAKTNLFFGRFASKMFAASSNPLAPDNEFEELDRPVRWWRNHFEEIASYETEYQILNQIHKWSLVTSWLYSPDNDDIFYGIKDIRVKRSLWFWDWVNDQEDLKFQSWNTLSPYVRGENGSVHEALPLLRSELFESFDDLAFIEGGVSNANHTDVIKSSSLDKIEDDWLPIPGRIPWNDKEKGIFLLNGIWIQPAEIDKKSGVIWNCSEVRKIRGVLSDVRPQMWLRSIEKNGITTQISTFAENGISSSRILLKTSAKGIEIAYFSGQVEKGIELFSRLAQAGDAADYLDRSKEHNEIENYLPLKAIGEYLVQLEGKENWIHLKIEMPWIQQVNLSPRWDFRTSGYTGRSNVVNVKFLQEEEAEELGASKDIIPSSPSRNIFRLREVVTEETDQYLLISKISLADKLIKSGQLEEFNRLFEDLRYHIGKKIETILEIKILCTLFLSRRALHEKGIFNAIDLFELSNPDKENLFEDILRQSRSQNIYIENPLLKTRPKDKSVLAINLPSELVSDKEITEVEFMRSLLDSDLIVENHPGFSNLDWGLPVRDVIKSILKGPVKPILGKVYLQDLKDYRLVFNSKKSLEYQFYEQEETYTSADLMPVLELESDRKTNGGGGVYNSLWRQFRDGDIPPPILFIGIPQEECGK